MKELILKSINDLIETGKCPLLGNVVVYGNTTAKELLATEDIKDYELLAVYDIYANFKKTEEIKKANLRIKALEMELVVYVEENNSIKLENANLRTNVVDKVKKPRLTAKQKNLTLIAI